MLKKDVIVIRTRELRKLQAAKKVLEKEITQKKAADLVGMSERQMRRIVKAVRDEGPKGVIHKSRGRPRLFRSIQREELSQGFRGFLVPP